MKWLTADDYSRTVIAWDWLQHPHIYSGVWLSLHFWLNGIFIYLFKDLLLAPIILNTIFSTLTVIYIYLIFEKIFGKQIAFWSTLIYTVFPFQVWLSTSAMPEPAFFFFVSFAVYYYLRWFENYLSDGIKNLVIVSISLNIANLLRYEGWFFSFAFIILTGILSFRKYKYRRQTIVSIAVSMTSLLTALWWLYQNYIDYGDPLFFIKETTRIFEHLNTAGFFQRLVQYPFFIFYIAPLTTILGLKKIYAVFRNKQNGFSGNFSLLKLFLAFNLTELLILMSSGIYGSGGTNMVSRYIVINTVFLFPFAVWQLMDLRKYLVISSISLIILVNIVWSFYYQEAYREDTFEVANLIKRLNEKNYFGEDDKIYFETAEGYFDIYPLQVISNTPERIISDTLPSVFPVTNPIKKMSSKKRLEEQQRLNIIELKKYLEGKNIKLFIARSDLLIDKLKKLSYKNEQIGDYRIFYLAESKAKVKKEEDRRIEELTAEISGNTISFDKKLVVKDIRIDNSNFGLNPQTITIKWQIADFGILDSLASSDDGFGRYKIKIELAPADNDTNVYEVYSNIFSERNTEEFFDAKEIKNILILKPFAMLNYSRRFKFTPFESGLYDLRLSVIDVNEQRLLKIFKGDSLYTYKPELETETDSTHKDFKTTQVRFRKLKEYYETKPFYPIGKIIALFPNVNYNQIIKSSEEITQIIIRNGIMLPVLQRYQGDHMLNIVFNYF